MEEGYLKVFNITTGVENPEIVENSLPLEKSKKLGGFAIFLIENPAVFCHFLSQKYTGNSINLLILGRDFPFLGSKIHK